MNATAKIRVLLALVCACLLLTTLIVQHTYTPKVDLVDAGKTLESNLRKKETYVAHIINNQGQIRALIADGNNAGDALAVIDSITTQHRVWLSIQSGGKLVFWTGVKILPDSAHQIKEGRSFIREPNGYYEAIRVTQSNYVLTFFIPVKAAYALQNAYLQNTFDKDLLTDNNIDLADFTDKNVYNVRSIDNEYLFSVKVKQGQINSKFNVAENILWTLDFVLLCVLIHLICLYIVKKGRLFLGITTLGIFILAIRAVNLLLHWPYFIGGIDLFSPAHYSAGWLYPSLGDFCVNSLLICWFVGFIYNYRKRLVKPIENKTAGYLTVGICVAVLLGVLAVAVDLFYSLVVTSNISFDVNNVLNLSIYSAVGIAMVAVSFLIFNLIDEILLVIVQKVNIPFIHKVLLFVAGLAVITLITILNGKPSLFYVLAGFVVAIRARAVWYNEGRLSPGPFIGVIMITALIASVKLSSFQTEREHHTREALVKKLESTDDPTADYVFRHLDDLIATDTSLIRFYYAGNRNNNYLRTYFRKSYFDGYLTKYDIKLYEFDNEGKPLNSDNGYILDNFKDLVMYSALKVSKYFYRDNDPFGYQSYFGLIPVAYQGKVLGTLVVSLKSKPLQFSDSFPELLVDRTLKQDDYLKGYSYAFYEDNRLLSQSGQYVYSTTNKDFDAPTHTYVFKNTSIPDPNWYKPAVHYSNLIYKPSGRRMIVISRQEYPLIYGITSLTFFFLVFLIFNGMVMGVRWVWRRIKLFQITDHEVEWAFTVKRERTLYKTRIQFSMIFAVVITLLFVGVITCFSVSNEYQEQQDNDITDRIIRIASALEAFIDKDTDPLKQETQVSFNAFADAYSTDLNLFDRGGNLVFTTQPKLYSLGLLVRKMNGKAFVYMSKLQKSEFVNDETIGLLKYKSVYAPIRNDQHKTIAYLQLPFFANDLEHKQRIGALLNVMINVYAIIFILIGALAIFIARQITNPLSVIQHSLSKTTYGGKNEAIVWERDDEIGALVKEYNNMIAELENSANRLAQSEREHAWREMAKQVAHEIKNPLTPLKLGLQLLEKSWRDKDPKFDAKFERFSKSFVEQIESLSTIASEFSAFAKMPETKMQRLNIFEILSQAVTVYRQMDNVKITMNIPEEPYYINADRDQLLRCFNNLLKNAIEAMRPNTVAEITISCVTEDRYIRIDIKDNGSGIPETLRTKIFEPNFTTKSSGTGLGLAFVKNSIENAGGKVWFETETDKGTIFHLRLPAA